MRNMPKFVEEIELESYPYAYARVACMKSKLLKKEDYDKMRKLKLPELAKFLEESEYKKEIDELATSYRGAGLLERAISRNLMRTIDKVKRISDEELLLLVNAYLMRRTIINIKILLRSKYAGLSKEEAKRNIIPGTIEQSFFERLADSETTEDFVRKLNFIKFEKFKKALDYYKAVNSIALIENAIDSHYYEWLIKFLGKLPEERQFADLLLSEIDLTNIKTIVRLKAEGTDSNTIRDYLLFSGLRLKTHLLKQLLDAKNTAEIASILKKTAYGKIIGAHIEEFEKGSYINFEIELDKYLLREAGKLMHRNPLSAEIILGYVMAKEIEIRNINILIKAKLLNMPDKVVDELLVIG